MTLFLVSCLHILFETFLGLGVLRLAYGEKVVWRTEDAPIAFLLGWFFETSLLGAGILGGLGLKTSLVVTGLALTLFGAWSLKKAIAARVQEIFSAIPGPASWQWYEWIIIVVIAEKVVFGTWYLFALPNTFSDALVQWGGRGHALFGGVNFSVDPQSAHFLGHVGRTTYPLGTPIWQAANALLAGGWTELAPKVHGLFFYIATVWLVWGAAWRLMRSRPLATAAVALVAANPLQVWHISVGFNDITVAAFAGASLAALTRRKWGLAGVLAAGAAWQKNEGLIMLVPALAMATALMEARGCFNLKALKNYLLGVTAIAPWLIYKMWHALPLGGSHGSTFGWQEGMPAYFFHIALMGPSHGGFWMIWLFLLALLGPVLFRDSMGRGTLAFSITISLMVPAIYFFSSQSLYLKTGTSVNRVLLQFFPAAILALSHGIGLFYRKDKKPDPS